MVAITCSVSQPNIHTAAEYYSQSFSMTNIGNIVINNGPGTVVGHLSITQLLPPPATLFDVPETRNPRFVGRKDVFAKMEEYMHKDNDNIGVALTGLGGMGKTQIALEYCYRYCSMHQYIFWIKADSELSMQS